MRQILSLIVLLACSASFAHAASNELLNTGATSLGASGTSTLGTITNGDLGAHRVITIDTLITRQESSGSDTWFAIGLNTAGGGVGNVPLTSDVGYLTRMRTDSGTAHQLFDSPSATENSGGTLTTTTKRATATITVAPGGIASGQFADIVVRYDDDNDGTNDHILGGYFDWSANSAAVRVATLNKAYDFNLVASSSDNHFDLFDTGVDDNGAVLAPGAVDTHWTVDGAPATVQANHPNWLANEAAGTVGGSSWISTVPAATNIAPGPYTFEQTFDMNGFNPETGVIVLDIGVDNSVSDIFLNGVSQGLSTGGFGSFNGPFEINSGFIKGINTLTIVAQNAGTTPNPGGLRVQVLQATAVISIPEPATGLLALLGMGMLGRRRRAA